MTYQMGERFIPSLSGWSEEASQMFYGNYKWASTYTHGKNVLDCACGSGYGTDIVSQNCASVVGADVDHAILKYGVEHYRNEKVSFRCFSITAIPYPDSFFDVVVSFDTIEHVRDDFRVLPELKRVTKEDGCIIISTPLRNYRKEQGEEGILDLTHIREYAAYEWLHMLSLHFSEAEFFARDQNFEFHEVHLNEYAGSPFDIAFVRLLRSPKSKINTIEAFKHVHCLQLGRDIKSLEIEAAKQGSRPSAQPKLSGWDALRRRLYKHC
jgi:2-polyprenyl-3-methyl-5-hydroxy-6-metoxy-1,4-benzoquinol methylase